jgi:putative two-component system response regulator
MTPHILFVDDEPHILDALKRALRAKNDVWQMHFVGGADAALQAMREISFDAIITDVRMPGKTGFELLEAILSQEETKDIPVIIVTGESDHDLKRRALDIGAADLLNKPVCTNDLIARIGSVLRLKSYQDQIKAQNALLEERVAARTQELIASRQDILWRLAKAGEYRDEVTGNHVLRVSRYCQVISEALGMENDFTEMIRLTSPLHDIGKIGIPDSILHKPGKLTPEEWEIMKQHSAIGAGIIKEDYTLSNVFVTMGARPHNPLLQMAASIALNHHEKWNGAGYPQGLVGEAIPLEARIVALADVYDALSSARPYKPPFAEPEVIACMTEGIGTHFDPYAYSGLERSFDAMHAIRYEYPDKDALTWKKAA